MYQAIIGEIGNEQGHVIGRYDTEDKALRAAKRACKRNYGRDGWYLTRQVS